MTKLRTRGKGVRVYVVDTGILETHEEFGGRAIRALDVTIPAGQDCRAFPIACGIDIYGHGTHVAATVVGATVGVASEATVFSIKVMGDDGTGQMSWLLAGMDYIVAQAAHPAVVSMSLGAHGRSPMFEEAVDEVVGSGISVVVAAGNEFNHAGEHFQNVPQAVVVGSTTIDEHGHDRRSPFSNFGPEVDIWAPGSDIVSASVVSRKALEELSGTSMACPHVAGTIAALLEDEPSLAPAAVLQRLISNVGLNYVRDISPDSPNRLLYVGHDGPPLPQPELVQVWYPDEMFDACKKNGDIGPDGEFQVCRCASRRSRCWRGWNPFTACTLSPKLQDIENKHIGRDYRSHYAWNCTNCWCPGSGWAAASCPSWWATSALLLLGLASAQRP